MPLYLKLNTRGLRLVLSTLLQSTNQSNYNEEDDKKAQKNQSNQRYQYRARVGMRGHLFIGGGGGVARIGIGLTSDTIG